MDTSLAYYLRSWAVAALAISLFALSATVMVRGQSVTVTPSQGPQGTVGATPNITIGTVTTRAAGSGATATLSGTSVNPILSLGVPNGATGAAGANGTNAILTAARATTDTTGLYAWTFPASCLNAGHIPALTAIAEGPNPQAGSNVNVQIEGVPTATAANFRVTKTANTTVALLGLTITVAVTGTSIGTTTLDLTCAPQ